MKSTNCKSSTKLWYEATNQYFFLAKTTPMHATNSYSLDINNSIYTTSFLQPNRYAHKQTSRPMAFQFHNIGALDIQVCVSAWGVRWCTPTTHSTLYKCRVFIYYIKIWSYISRFNIIKADYRELWQYFRNIIFNNLISFSVSFYFYCY